MSARGLLVLTSNRESHSDVRRVVGDAVAASVGYARPATPDEFDLRARWRRTLGDGADHLRVPLSWFSSLTRPYRGREAPNLDAILVLAYSVSRFAAGDTEGPGVLYAGVDTADTLSVPEHKSIDVELGMSPARRKRATRYLAERDLLTRVVVKGTVPWWSVETRRVGSYLFLIPNVQNVELL